MAAKPCTIPTRYVAPSSIGPAPSIGRGGGGRLAVANRQAGGLDNVGERRIPHPERHLLALSLLWNDNVGLAALVEERGQPRELDTVNIDGHAR